MKNEIFGIEMVAPIHFIRLNHTLIWRYYDKQSDRFFSFFETSDNFEVFLDSPNVLIIGNGLLASVFEKKDGALLRVENEESHEFFDMPQVLRATSNKDDVVYVIESSCSLERFGFRYLVFCRGVMFKALKIDSVLEEDCFFRIHLSSGKVMTIADEREYLEDGSYNLVSLRISIV